jgi:hypothetical protein
VGKSTRGAHRKPSLLPTSAIDHGVLMRILAKPDNIRSFELTIAENKGPVSRTATMP